jgi:hypothetical protein
LPDSSAATDRARPAGAWIGIGAQSIPPEFPRIIRAESAGFLHRPRVPPAQPCSSPRRAERDSGSATCRKTLGWPAIAAACWRCRHRAGGGMADRPIGHPPYQTAGIASVGRNADRRFPHLRRGAAPDRHAAPSPQVPALRQPGGWRIVLRASPYNARNFGSDRVPDRCSGVRREVGDRDGREDDGSLCRASALRAKQRGCRIIGGGGFRAGPISLRLICWSGAQICWCGTSMPWGRRCTAQ